MRRKHVPQRTCIGCRKIRSKRQMVRLVRTRERQLVIDETGKRNGRGAYLCRQRSCWEPILKGKQLGRALEMDIGEEEKEMLHSYMTTLPAQEELEATHGRHSTVAGPAQRRK